MIIYYLQHVAFEGLGSIEKWAHNHRLGVSAIRLYENGTFPDPKRLEALVVLGGPMGINDEEKFPWLVPEMHFIEKVIKNGVPVLGICLGAQLLAHVLGAKVYPNNEKEIGWFSVTKTVSSNDHKIATILPDKMEVFHWHGDTFDLPEDAIQLYRSEACEHQAFIYDNNVTALQFHLETTPASIDALINHCSEELIDAPFVQSAEAMRKGTSRFQTINKNMDILLSQIFRIRQ
jgi:GMP synthase-like glutamine amidotransferase